MSCHVQPFGRGGSGDVMSVLSSGEAGAGLPGLGGWTSAFAFGPSIIPLHDTVWIVIGIVLTYYDPGVLDGFLGNRNTHFNLSAHYLFVAFDAPFLALGEISKVGYFTSEVGGFPANIGGDSSSGYPLQKIDTTFSV